MADARQSEENQMNDRYIAHLTHDIVGHLATIQSCLGVALTGTLDKQSSEFVQRAYNRTCKLTNFTKTMIKLDRKIRQNGKMETSVFSLKHTVNNVIDALRSKAGEKSIQLHCSFSDTLHNICGNEPSIEEMLTNLLLIAIDDTQANGEISVSVMNQHNFVRLQISFIRHNIPVIEQPKKHDELFHNNVSDTDKSGSDFEWIIAQYIAEIHGGNITINNEKEEKAAITVNLPCLK
jgi:signal transduction histidine kinase